MLNNCFIKLQGVCPNTRPSGDTFAAHPPSRAPCRRSVQTPGAQAVGAQTSPSLLPKPTAHLPRSGAILGFISAGCEHHDAAGEGHLGAGWRCPPPSPMGAGGRGGLSPAGKEGSRPGTLKLQALFGCVGGGVAHTEGGGRRGRGGSGGRGEPAGLPAPGGAGGFSWRGGRRRAGATACPGCA